MTDCFNLVWADDEVRSLYENNEMLFQRYNINVKCFTDSNSAIKYIRQNAELVDGIITDAKFGRTPGCVFKDDERTFPGLSQFIQELFSLRKDTGKELPAWIFTGYGNLLREKYCPEDLDCFQPEIIDKSSNYEQLCKWMELLTTHIRESNDRDFMVRQENAEFFEMCNGDLLDSRLERKLFDIFRFDPQQPNSPFNEIRIIAEEVMDVLHKKGIIHHFLADIHSLGKRLDELKKAQSKLGIADYVITSLALIVNMTNPESHSSEEAKMQAMGLMPFAYGMTVGALKTVLYWLKDFVSRPRLQAEQPTQAKHINGQETKAQGPIESSACRAAEQLVILSESKVEKTSPEPECLAVEEVSSEEEVQIVEGVLGVRAYTLNVDEGYIIFPRHLVKKNWIPGKTRLRAEVDDVKGHMEVVHVLDKIN